LEKNSIYQQPKSIKQIHLQGSSAHKAENTVCYILNNRPKCFNCMMHSRHQVALLNLKQTVI